MLLFVLKKNLGWPGNTLFRFDMFLSIEKEIIKFDYLFFLMEILCFRSVLIYWKYFQIRVILFSRVVMAECIY